MALFLFLSALLLLCESSHETSAHECKTGAEYSVKGMMLKSHIYKTMSVSLGHECLKACYRDVACQSFNYVLSQSTCEFSNRIQEARPEDFVPDSNRYYFKRDRERVPLGSIPELPAESCKEIKASEGGKAVSGKYWLNSVVKDKSVNAYCDMDTEDADECSASVPVCAVNASCQNLQGSYSCSCKPGFSGDGKVCTYVDECASNPCTNGGTCVDGINGYTCTCPLNYRGNRCEKVGCTLTLKSVGNPVTHHNRSPTQGAWMKDPLGVMGNDTIFVMQSYSSNDKVEEFENLSKFKAGVVRKTYTLPFKWDGTGAVVYGNHLYYNRENSQFIIKYNLFTSNIDNHITLSGYSPRSIAYTWGGYSGVDLAVDENGLWVLWGNTGNGSRLSASKIEGDVIVNSYNLATERMNSMGNAFIACGVIYCIDSYNSNPTTINFAYDTKTGNQWNPNIQFTNQYGYNSMVDYNPKEKLLYAWDNHKQLTYSLTWN